MWIRCFQCPPPYAVLDDKHKIRLLQICMKQGLPRAARLARCAFACVRKGYQ